VTAAAHDSRAPIGVCLRPEYDEYSLDRMDEYAQLAERNGFHSVWLAESWGLDALALLSHVGAVTRRIKLGTAIVNVFSRTPALLSMASVTLNDLYDGRFILGLGTSTKALVEGWHGMRFDHPVPRLRDTVHLVRELTSGKQAEYEGSVLAVKGYRLRVRPRSASPPIYLAALGPEAMRAVAEVADGWLPYLLPLRGLSDSVAGIRDRAAEAGRAPDAICIAPMVLTAVADDRETGRAAAREHIAFYMGAMGPHYRGFVARFGFEREVEAIRVAWAARQHADARAAVTDEMVDEIAVAGTPDECRAKLAAVRAAGADLPILFFPGACTNRMVELALQTMGTA
jgi:5,10-methylenetetrahydromethanopterin reductase